VRVSEIADYLEAMIPSLRRFDKNNDDIDRANELVPALPDQFFNGRKSPSATGSEFLTAMGMNATVH
jgi:hypothetical protein